MFPLPKFYDLRHLAWTRDAHSSSLSRNHTDDLDLGAQPTAQTILGEPKGHISFVSRSEVEPDVPAFTSPQRLRVLIRMVM